MPLGVPPCFSGFLPWLFAWHFSAAVNTLGPTQSWWPFRKGCGESDAVLICLRCYRPLRISMKEGAKETWSASPKSIRAASVRGWG